MSLLEPEISPFFHQSSSTISYIVADKKNKVVALIDPVADFNISTAQMTHEFSNQMVDFIRSNNYQLEWIIETHVHADHVTDAQYIKGQLGGKISIGNKIREVQETFAGIYNENEFFRCDGSQFDHLFEPNEEFMIGEIKAKAIATPGHTPACMSFSIGNVLFVGDAIFMPDFGTSRCDFPGGSAKDLYNSAQKLTALPDETRVFVGHDYGPGGRPIIWETTIIKERRYNVHVGEGIKLDEFVTMRETRDAQLNLPAMIIPAIQINMRAGNLPDPDSNGISYLKTPVNNFLVS